MKQRRREPRIEKPGPSPVVAPSIPPGELIQAGGFSGSLPVFGAGGQAQGRKRGNATVRHEKFDESDTGSPGGSRPARRETAAGVHNDLCLFITRKTTRVNILIASRATSNRTLLLTDRVVLRPMVPSV
jgi:hypothetical protein